MKIRNGHLPAIDDGLTTITSNALCMVRKPSLLDGRRWRAVRAVLADAGRIDRKGFIASLTSVASKLPFAYAKMVFLIPSLSFERALGWAVRKGTNFGGV